MIDLKPFIITGPTVVANSGGKTSGYNLWLHLQAHGGIIPEQGRAMFTNTGWEHPLTLDFLAEQERRWNVRIAWLEFCRRPATPAELQQMESRWQHAQDRLARFIAEPSSFFVSRRRQKSPDGLFAQDAEERKSEAVRKATKYALWCSHCWLKAKLIGVDTYRRVDRQTADTTGRPYTELLQGLFRFRTEVKKLPGVLPNGVQRICTGHLKVKITTKFARDEWGVKPSGFEARLGLRSDEEDRIKNAANWSTNEGGRPVFPLDEAGIIKEDVAAFWSTQPFGLALKAHEGNCGGCYMKRRAALLDLIRRDFFDVDWWQEWEERTGQRFRQERSYRGLREAARIELDLLPPDDGDNGITCEGGYCSN